MQYTLDRDEEAVAQAIKEAHKAGTAPIFYTLPDEVRPPQRGMHYGMPCGYNNEQALRSVIRFAYLSCVDEFLRIDKLPSGHGDADVVFFPKKASSMPLILVELKWDRTADGAIRQIKKRDYPQVLKDYGGKILLVGINYSSKNYKHTCKIEEYRK